MRPQPLVFAVSSTVLANVLSCAMCVGSSAAPGSRYSKARQDAPYLWVRVRCVEALVMASGVSILLEFSARGQVNPLLPD